MYIKCIFISDITFTMCALLQVIKSRLCCCGGKKDHGIYNLCPNRDYLSDECHECGVRKGKHRKSCKMKYDDVNNELVKRLELKEKGCIFCGLYDGNHSSECYKGRAQLLHPDICLECGMFDYHHISTCVRNSTKVPKQIINSSKHVKFCSENEEQTFNKDSIVAHVTRCCT